MAKFSFSVDSVNITPRTYNSIDLDVVIDNSDLYGIVWDMVCSLRNSHKQDLFDMLKDEGYGND